MRGFLQLSGKADLRLEANYFNEELSEWEPLIEKLETKDGFRSWELSVGVSLLLYGVFLLDVLFLLDHWVWSVVMMDKNGVGVAYSKGYVEWSH